MTSNIFRGYRTGDAVRAGVAVGGMLIATVGQLANAASAHADDPFTEMFDNVQLTISMADDSFVAGAAAFAGDDIPQAMNFDLAGVESLLFGPSQDLFLNSVELLANAPLSSGTLIGELQGLPIDWADAVVQAQGLVGAAQFDFEDAALEFAAGDYVFAAGLDTAGADFLLFLVPNDLIIGAAESLFGI